MNDWGRRRSHQWVEKESWKRNHYSKTCSPAAVFRGQKATLLAEAWVDLKFSWSKESKNVPEMFRNRTSEIK